MAKEKYDGAMGTLVISEISARAGGWNCPNAECEVWNPTGNQVCKECTVNLDGKDSRGSSFMNKDEKEQSGCGSWETCTSGDVDEDEDVEVASGSDEDPVHEGSEHGSGNNNLRSF